MVKKGVFIIVFSILLVGCDDDFSQGRCDEGFFEQSDGNGGSLCVPITDVGTINPVLDSVDLKEID